LRSIRPALRHVDGGALREAGHDRLDQLLQRVARVQRRPERLAGAREQPLPALGALDGRDVLDHVDDVEQAALRSRSADTFCSSQRSSPVARTTLRTRIGGASRSPRRSRRRAPPRA